MADSSSVDARLAPYREKRDFTRTPEPYGHAGGAVFVVHRHGMARSRFEVRLALDGVLKTWSVARGPSLDPSQKRLAVAADDYALGFAGFEGRLGGEAAIVWDRGWWSPLLPGSDPAADLAAGMLKFGVVAERMTGAWVLIRMKPRAWETRANWLLIKERDAHARPGSGAALVEPETSVASGRTLAEIGADAAGATR